MVLRELLLLPCVLAAWSSASSAIRTHSLRSSILNLHLLQLIEPGSSLRFAVSVELLATMLTEPTLAADELAKLLRQTQAALITSRDDDGALASRGLRRKLFANHPHGKRLAGSIDSLDRIDVPAIRQHLGQFGSEGAILALGGDIDEATAQRFAEMLTQRLPAGTRRDYPAADPTPPTGRHLLIVDKPGRTQSKVGIATLGSHAADPDHTALVVANTAFGGTFTSRLTREVRAKRGWSYGASSHLTHSRIREAFGMWTAPAAADTASCIALELELLQTWHDEGITADELAFCQDCLRRSYAFEIDTAKKRLHQQLERQLLDLPADYHSGFIDRVSGVTLEQANAAVAKRIDPAALWVCVVCSDEDIGEELRQMQDWASVTVEPFDLE